MTLDDLVRNPDLATALSRKELVDIYRRAARVEADLHALLMAHPAEASCDETAGGLLTLPDVAKILKIPESKAYELARRGELPTVAIPGGKYVRVRPADLNALIDACVLPMVTSRRDQARVPAAPQATRSLTGAARSRHGHHQGVGLAVGGGRAADLGAGGPVSDAPGPDAG
jgi:excisionase family DNA binding protein